MKYMTADNLAYIRILPEEGPIHATSGSILPPSHPHSDKF